MKNINKISAKQLATAICMLFLILVMIPGALAQESVVHHEQDPERDELLKTNATPDKSTPIMLNVVGGDARIHDLTIGRGGGNANTNSAFGRSALISNTSGTRNTAFGRSALTANTTGDNNTAIGYYALYNSTTGSSNTAVGRAPLYFNKTGYSNIAIGGRALYHNTDRSNLVAVGDSALFNNGVGASGSFQATENTALGSKTLFSNTTGYWNTAMGYHTLINNNTGYSNTAIGREALLDNTTGYQNTAIGRNALPRNTTGHSNTGIGPAALGFNTSGNNNTAVGYVAGSWSVISIINQGTFVGVQSRPTANDLSNITGIGYQARPDGNNTIHLGNTTIAHIKGQVDFTKFSDGNYKTNINEDVIGLDFILRLRPVSYNVDIHRLAADVGEDETMDEEGNKVMSIPDEFTLKSRNKRSAVREVGFVAQEVEALVLEMEVPFNGVDAPQNETGKYGLRYASFVVPLVKAVQEQQAQINLLSPEGFDTLMADFQALKEERVMLAASQEALLQEVETLALLHADLAEENRRLHHQVGEMIALLGTLSDQVQSCCQAHTGTDTSTGSRRTSMNQPQLEQNIPNPFTENTLVRYFLPEGFRTASIIVTDAGGTQLMRFAITEPGSGHVVIEGRSLGAGTYVYSLVVDGRVVDSKRMVLI